MAIPDAVSAESRIDANPNSLVRPNLEALTETRAEARAEKRAGTGLGGFTASAPRPPAAATAVNRLLEHPALWRAGQLQRAPAARSSGFAELDAHLPGGGWPQAGLAEFLLGTTGVGELRVLAPLIRTLSREQARWIAWINPPFTPYAPALEALGIELDRMLVINPRTHQEALWALEQTSRSGSCSLALAWLDERQLKPQEARRLQFAAQQGHMLTCLFRPEQAAMTQSMAELRLQLAPAEPGSLTLDIRKRRGGWPVSGIRLTIDESVRPEAVTVQLSSWRRYRQQLATTLGLATIDADIDADSHGNGQERRWSALGVKPTGVESTGAEPTLAHAPLEVAPPVTH